MRAAGKYMRSLLNTNQASEKVRRQAYDEINSSLTKAFALPSLNEYSKTFSLKGLMVKSVEMFVGSRSIPKNVVLAKHLLEIAEGKAKTQTEKTEIEYYKCFFLRIDAFQNGKKHQFDLSTEMINKLAEEKGHPQSCYLVGKQLFNVGQMASSMEQRKNLMKLAAFYFQKSLTQNQYGGLFYLGEILKNAEYSQMTEEEVREFFVFGAAMGDPLCYFRMSHLYLKEGKTSLAMRYLKMAAEDGVIEAQHNLGCEYLDGSRVKKDQVKALAWFLHASANGFIQSKYNVVYLFMTGSECGRIKPNRKAAILKLQQLKEVGQDVDDKIKQLVQVDQGEEESSH